MSDSKHLKSKFAVAMLALLGAFLAVVVATFSWYIYNTRAHTTNVRMVAGAGISLQISDEYGGGYSSATLLAEFIGPLNPSSTDNILNGFQKVVGFTKGAENQPMLVANLFGRSADADYYQTSLFFRTNGVAQNVYVSDISFEDSDVNNPISSAIRVGFVAHYPGENQRADANTMRIFSISDAKNPQKEYNTQTGREGYVLDSTKTDGSTVPFTPYSMDNYCNYDTATGLTTLKADSVPICQVVGGDDGAYGTPVQVDIYIWLEGCDEDCTNNLGMTTLKNLALSFASSPVE